MSHSELQIDEIIINKRFDELSNAEKDIIKDVAVNEIKFNQTKLMLVAIAKEINAIPTIEPKPATKDYLVNEFKKNRPINADRKSGLGFLFPSSKPLLLKPGIQILAAAAIFLLVFTLFKPTDSILNETKDVAFVETNKTKTQENKEELKVIEAVTDEINKVETIDGIVKIEEGKPTNTQTSSDQQNNLIGSLKNADKETKKDKEFVSNEKPFVKDMEAMNEMADASPPPPSVYNVVQADSKIQDDNLALAKNSESRAKNDESVANSPATGTTLMANAATVQKEKAENKKSAKSVAVVKLSKSLADNAELIGYFYTAM